MLSDLYAGALQQSVRVSLLFSVTKWVFDDSTPSMLGRLLGGKVFAQPLNP